MLDLNEPPAADNYESGPESSNVGGGRDCSDRRGREGSVHRSTENRGVDYGVTKEFRTGVSVEGRAESSEVEQVALAACRLDERSVGKRNRRRGGGNSEDRKARSTGKAGPDLREESAECEGERALKIARVGFPESAGELISDGSPRFSSVSPGGEDTAPQQARSEVRQGLSPLRIGHVAQGHAQDRGSNPESPNFLQLGRGPAFGTSAENAVSSRAATPFEPSTSVPVAPSSGGEPAIAPAWPQWPSVSFPLPVLPMPEASFHRETSAFTTNPQPFPGASHLYPAVAVSHLGDCGYGPPVPCLGAVNPAARSEAGQSHSSLPETGTVNSLLTGWASQLQETGQQKQVTDRMVTEISELFGRLAQSGAAFQHLWGPPGQHPMWLMTPAAQQQYLASLFQPGAAAFPQPGLVNPAFLPPNPLAYQVPALWSQTKDP